MSTGKRLAGLLLLTTSLTFPAIVHAQSADAQAQDELSGTVEDTPPEEEYDQSDISIPGGGIIVTGRRGRDPQRASTQVLNVLTEADIARTGEGDIAGALSRVSGLSLVGNGRVFVRGLGDRYSLALLNGLPLPSPEPLSRVVPLDIFPTNVVSSGLVQKTYSANFPGEFGGGVINLTTKAVPTEDFLTISIGGGGDTLTTFQNGLTYFGSNFDSVGFDNGNRDIPSNLQAFFNSGDRLEQLDPLASNAIAGQLFPTNLVTLQQNSTLPMNFSANITGGLSFELGGDTYLGIVATAGISNDWRNRSVLSQAGSADLSQVFETTNTFITDNNVLVNALIGVGLDIGEHTIRWTNLYIRDSLKTARLGERFDVQQGDSGFDFRDQQTAWFERQLIDTQLVAELKFGKFGVDLRGGFARTDREAPYNATFNYVRTNNPGDPFGNDFRVDIGGLRGQTGIRALVEFDDLQEDTYFGGIDLSYELLDNLDITAGYAYSDLDRRSSSRGIQSLVGCGPLCELQDDGGNPLLSDQAAALTIEALGLRKPGDIINGATLAGFNVRLNERTPFPVFDAALQVHAGYGQLRWLPLDTLTVEVGARFEDATQVVGLDQTIFTTPIPGATPTNIANDYWLPAATVTWEVMDDLQLRFAASKTIARPQFRELVEQLYFDPESNRRFVGNPLLQDSQLKNAEARAEYYLGGTNRISLAGFYKEIDNPIESFATITPGEFRTSFANAPAAQLYGAELDISYGFDLSNWGSFFETKQFLVLANYTYTQSSLNVDPSVDRASCTQRAPTPEDPGRCAAELFIDGASLVGQSDHVANLALSLEDIEKVQQISLLFNYASERVTARGFNRLPDIVEDPGLTVDFVARSEVKVAGQPLELSFEVRNIFGRGNFEFQEFQGNRIDINTFRVGTAFNLGIKAMF